MACFHDLSVVELSEVYCLCLSKNAPALLGVTDRTECVVSKFDVALCRVRHAHYVGRSPLLRIGFLKFNEGTKSQKSINNGESQNRALIKISFEAWAIFCKQKKIEVHASDNISICRSVPDLESGKPISW